MNQSATPVDGALVESAAVAPRRIFALMNEVRRTVKTVAKDGFNEHFKFQYASIDGVIGTLHDALVKHGIMIVPDELDYAKDGNLTTVELLVTFVNVEDANDRFTTRWVGTATDTADKGHAKALTAAFKECLKKTFFLAAGELDADKDAVPHVGDRLSSAQQQAILDALDGAGKELQPVLEYYKYERLEDIPGNLFDRIMRAIGKKSPKGSA